MKGSALKITLLIVYLLLVVLGIGNATEDWSFIVLPDWHNAEGFATRGDNATHYDALYDQVHYVKTNYGGDLVVLPGDSNTGKWDTEDFAQKFKPELDVGERVLEAGRNCYGTMRNLFTEAGYEQILMAIGDHELGGNNWRPNSTKVNSLDEYRQAIIEGFNVEPTTGKFLFNKNVGAAPSRPLKTPFRQTSYAYQHKNVLFVTLDAFLSKPDVFIDKENGLGGEGIITCTIQGKHLTWFENILVEANKDETIKHIVVQAHLPIIQPVRKVSCSGQFMDYGEDGVLWKTMVKYGVDIYLAGEVHTNTVTKDPDSNLLQIVSRGNSFNNFLKIDVTDDVLNITSYNEIGPKPKNNYNYIPYGNLIIDKGVLCHMMDKEFIAKPSDSTEENKHDAARNIRKLNLLDNESVSRLALIACGSGSSAICGYQSPRWVGRKKRYNVRCCSDYRIRSQNTRKKKNCPSAASCFKRSTFRKLRFGGFEKSSCNNGLCSGKVTFSQANKLCAKVRGHICTRSQLARDCAEFSGCNSDNKFVWATQDPKTEIPTLIPSALPSALPTLSHSPSNTPSDFPSNVPSMIPSTLPSFVPSVTPSHSPSNIPSPFPSNLPSARPSASPSTVPSSSPSISPSEIPSDSPSNVPSSSPSSSPSTIPTALPSGIPSISYLPSVVPSVTPSHSPSNLPSASPSSLPSDIPSASPSTVPSSSPSISPSEIPSDSPSNVPSSSPSSSPSTTPSVFPSSIPSISYLPSVVPSALPSYYPSNRPSSSPSSLPSDIPSASPSGIPSSSPSILPSVIPSSYPSSSPSTSFPSVNPSTIPSNVPSTTPTVSPSNVPSIMPSDYPSSMPSHPPSSLPSVTPSNSPSRIPSSSPSSLPSAIPSASPSSSPSLSPSNLPSLIPSTSPSIIPSISSLPTALPSSYPSLSPSLKPSASPSTTPTTSQAPSDVPSLSPSQMPSISPSLLPTIIPSASPSIVPSSLPSRTPSAIPSISSEPTLFPRCTQISSSGVLELLDRSSALVHLDFENSIFLWKRQVVGMHHDDVKTTLLGRRITIRGIESTRSLPNQGSFGQPYDAQIANVKLKNNSNNFKKGKFGILTENSRIGIYGFGPHSGGSTISYSLLISTKSESDMILVHYGHGFSLNSNKNIYTLTLSNGTPMLYISHVAILKPEKEYDLNDGNWHHVAVSMPSNSCRLSDVIMYVDGKTVETIATRNYSIFFVTSGRLSIGGFGYSNHGYESLFPHLSPFIGKMDEFQMWGRAIRNDDEFWY